MNIGGLLALTFVPLVFLVGCSSSLPGDTPSHNAPGASSDTGGSAGLSRAIVQLWPEVRAGLEGDIPSGVLADAKLGAPVAGSEEYNMGTPLLAHWVVPDESRSDMGDWFAAMRPTPLNSRSYLVPVLKGGREIAEFAVERDADGHWVIGNTHAGPGDLEAQLAAKARLRELLGAGTVCRTAVFLPSGLEFVVGKNDSTQAAVYLTFVNHGKGIAMTNVRLPNEGDVFTEDQLKALFKGEQAKPQPTSPSVG